MVKSTTSYSAGLNGLSAYDFDNEQDAHLVDYIRSLTGVSQEEANEMFDAIQRWAVGSNRIKAAQRGENDNQEDIEAVEKINQFIDKSPDYKGNLIRIMKVPEGTKFRKNGIITSDETITSWTVPGNEEKALHGFGALDSPGLTVVLHVKATKGADTRGISNLDGLDQEVFQKGGYDKSLKVVRSKSRTFKSWAFPEGVKILDVWLEE